MSQIVVADYDYTGQDETQLTFAEGDRIVVVEEDESGWWTGRLEKNGKEGFFPSTYIRKMGDGNETNSNEVQKEEQEEEEYQTIAIAQENDNNNDESLELQPKEEEEEEEDNQNLDVTKKKLNGKVFKLHKDVSAPDMHDIPEPGPDLEEAKEGSPTSKTSRPPPRSEMINDKNNKNNAYIRKNKDKARTLSVVDNYDGPSDAQSENYYAGQVLNLKTNPNSKSRYGLAAHYMSLSSSMCTIFLGMSCWAWYNGSIYLGQLSLTGYTLELIIGLYSFFGGIVMFFWEYLRGDVRKKISFPVRTIGYFLFGVPCFFVIPSALSGVLWMNTAIFSFLAFRAEETYERKEKRSYSDEKPLTPKEKLLQFFNPIRIMQNSKNKLTQIRQQSKVKKYAFVVVYLLFNIIYVLYNAAYYDGVVKALNQGAQTATDVGDFAGEDLQALGSLNTDPSTGDAIIVTNSWFPIAKMFGNLLDINCAFVLLPVCRSFIAQLYNISTDQRSVSRFVNFLLSFMPLDKAMQFHKLCAFLVVVGTVFHTWAHFNHFAAVPATYEGIYGPTVWVSGALIIVCMHLLYCTSFSAVRHGKFELFWYTHHLFVIFFISILFHGRNSFNPNFWKWFLVPGALYIIERTLRECKSRQAVGVVSVLHMNTERAKVFCLELEKTGPIKNHQEGQYVFIKAPIISKNQWHPFTISSPPDQNTLTLHIRNMGDGSWTDRLQQFFQALGPRKAYTELYHRDANNLVPQTIGPDGNSLICIDGPMAAPTQHLGEYSTSIIVGAGIGVTPVRATLQSIIYYRFKRGIGRSYPDHAYCVWIVNYKQLSAYRWMCRSLKEAEDELYNMKKINTKQMEHKLLQIHIFVTSAPTDCTGNFDPEIVANPDNDRQRDLQIWGTHYDDVLHTDGGGIERVGAPFTSTDIWRCLKEPSPDGPTQIGDIIIHKGRPKWDQFFKPIQQAHRGNKIGVMFCGPDIIAKDLKKNCGEFTDFKTKTVFVLHKENF